MGAAYAWQPQSQLHELRLSVHTPGYGAASDVLQRRRRDDDFLPIELSAYVGTVQLPEVRFFGINDDTRIAVGFEGLVALHNAIMRIRVLRNDPFLLDSFPYAVDAWPFHAGITVATDTF